MRTVESPYRPGGAGISTRLQPKLFPIFASPLPAEKRAFPSRIETSVIFLFSTACGGLLLQPRVERCAPVPPACLSRLIGANLAPNRPKNMLIPFRLLGFIHSGEFPPAEAARQRGRVKSLP